MAGSVKAMIWPIPLSQIEEIVSAHLGPGRIRGNEQHPARRQLSMYLAKHVGGWSLSNGRHHTTVLHAIANIEQLPAPFFCAPSHTR